MMRRERAKEFRFATMLFAQTASDKQALSMPTLYDPWAAGVGYGGADQPSIVTRPAGDGVQLYRCRIPHTSQVGWEPEIYKAAWVAINKGNAGTIDDPIPAVRGMEYTYGLYYIDEEDGNIYLCKRTGEPEGGTIVLQYLPHELIGQYFEAVTG